MGAVLDKKREKRKPCSASLKPFIKDQNRWKGIFSEVKSDRTCFLFVIFLENDIWIKAHFVRAGQALHTQRRIWYIYHRQLAPKGGVVYERPNFVGYRTTFCGTNISIG